MLMMVVRVTLVRVPIVMVSVLVRVAEPKPWRGTIVINTPPPRNPSRALGKALYYLSLVFLHHY